MQSLKVPLVKQKELARKTKSFYFEKPSDFDFKAGQHANFIIDGKLNTFTIASSPNEKHIEIATRMTGSDFKKTLNSMKKGDEMQVFGPMGDFILPESGKLVFIAGGIGITPFRSMIKYAVEKNLGHKIKLLYSDKTKEDIAYLDELENLENDNIEIIATFTREKVDGYEEGRIDEDMIKKYCDTDAIFYIAGHPKMVVAMRNLLENMSIKNIEFEEFSGY